VDFKYDEEERRRKKRVNNNIYYFYSVEMSPTANRRQTSTSTSFTFIKGRQGSRKIICSSKTRVNSTHNQVPQQKILGWMITSTTTVAQISSDF
jgi:hypothetical protein